MSWMAAALLAKVSAVEGGGKEKSLGVQQEKQTTLCVWGTREAQVWYQPGSDTDQSPPRLRDPKMTGYRALRIPFPA